MTINFDWNDQTVEFSIFASVCLLPKRKKKKFSVFATICLAKQEREGNEEKIRCLAKSFLQLLYLRLSSVLCVRPVTQLATYKHFLTFLHCAFSSVSSNCLPLYFFAFFPLWCMSNKSLSWLHTSIS